MQNDNIDFIEKTFRVTMNNLFKTIDHKNDNKDCSFFRDQERDAIYFNMKVGQRKVRAYVACHEVVESYSKIFRNIQYGERNFIVLTVDRQDGKSLELFRTEKRTPSKVYYPLFGNDPEYFLSNRLKDENLEIEYTKEMFSLLKATDKNEFKYNITHSKTENIDLIYDEEFISEIEKKYEEIRPLYETKEKVKRIKKVKDRI